MRIAFTPVALILVALGIGLTAWPSGRVDVAFAGLMLLWVGGVMAARQSGPMIRYGGTFFLSSFVWAALGLGFPASFNRWPTDETASSGGGALQTATLTDDRYKGFTAMPATVRSTGAQFTVTNEGAQPWEDVTVAIVGADTTEYDFRVPELAPGELANLPAARFVSPKGDRFNAQRSHPRTLVITAMVGAGGPMGVYAAQLQP